MALKFLRGPKQLDSSTEWRAERRHWQWRRKRTIGGGGGNDNNNDKRQSQFSFFRWRKCHRPLLLITHFALTNSLFQIGFFKKNHLYPCLAELCPLGELLPGVDVWVLSPLKGLLQLVQLEKLNWQSWTQCFPMYTVKWRFAAQKLKYSRFMRQQGH